MSTISYPHHEVHAGTAFVVADIQTLNDGVSFEYLLQTPDTTKWVHALIKCAGSYDTKVTLFEATTKTTGTTMTEINRNRNSANTAGLVVTHTPGGAGDGTQLWTARFGNDSGPASLGSGVGQIRGDNEWMLQQNAAYLLRVTSYTDNNNISIEIDWYEHTDKN